MRKFTFIWVIENYSYCWHEVGEELVSPTFFVEIMQSTSWNLKIYPRGYEDEGPNFIGLGLLRCDDCGGPEDIQLNCELSILDAKDRVLESAEIEENVFEKGEEYDCEEFYDRLEYHQVVKNEVTNPDILKVCLKIWVGEGKVEKEDFSCARTRIGLEKISFINIIENFSKLQPNQKKPFSVRSVSNYGLHLYGNIFLKREPDSEDEVIIEIHHRWENVDGDLMTCHIYLISSSGEELECGKIDTRNYIDKMDFLSFPINFPEDLLEKKLAYLPNDILTLRCECTLSTGTELQRIEETFYDLHLTPSLRVKLHNSSVSSFRAEAKSVLEEFKNLYKDQILSDVQLKTINKAFPAHKNVLCARSPVFRAMLTTNMKEKIMDCIEVDDLDEITIDQFLIFLYTDVLEDIQWESAMKLYYAADKYQVRRLRDICASFLITGLNKHNVIDLLILADRHQDSDLKTAVEKFICKKHGAIFGTDEWEIFMDTNPQLAMKTMHFYLKKKAITT